MPKPKPPKAPPAPPPVPEPEDPNIQAAAGAAYSASQRRKGYAATHLTRDLSGGALGNTVGTRTTLGGDRR